MVMANNYATNDDADVGKKLKKNNTTIKNLKKEEENENENEIVKYWYYFIFS